MKKSALGIGSRPELSSRSWRRIEHLLAPIFFVLIGLQVDVTALANVNVLLMGLLLTAAAVAGKLAASLGVMGGTDRLIVGIGMLPRVEVALIVASMGKSLGILNDALYSVIIIVVSLTVLMTPPLLKWSIERKRNKTPRPVQSTFRNHTISGCVYPPACTGIDRTLCS